MEPFVKLTLTPRQKAAILLTELGASPEGHYLAEHIYEMLNLSKAEEEKLMKEIKALGKYNPNISLMAERENVVLEEFMDWGRAHGFKVPEIFIPQNDFEQKNAEIIKSIKSDPDSLASVLRSWLSE